MQLILVAHIFLSFSSYIKAKELAPKGNGLWSFKCEFYHPAQKHCKVRMHIKLSEDENGEKIGTVIRLD